MPPDLTFGPYRARERSPRGEAGVAVMMAILATLFCGLFLGEAVTDALGITTTPESRARSSCSERWESLEAGGGDGWSSRDAWMDDCVPTYVRQHQGAD